MQNYPVGYTQQNPSQYVQTQTMPAAQSSAGSSGAVFNIGGNAPNSIPVNGASGVTINIVGASVNPNGANINNTYNGAALPGQGR